MDFEFKKIALMFPQLINTNQSHLLLFVKDTDKTNKFVEMFNELQKTDLKNDYHIIKCKKEGEQIDCSEMLKFKLSINVKQLPSIYLINNTVAEIPIEKINTIDDLRQILSQ